MKQIVVTTRHGTCTAFIPTADDCLEMKVGDQALDAFGNLATVNEIFARGISDKGRAYVCYYTDTGSGGRVSNSIMAGEVQRTVRLCRLLDSEQIRRMDEPAEGGRA